VGDLLLGGQAEEVEFGGGKVAVGHAIREVNFEDHFLKKVSFFLKHPDQGILEHMHILCQYKFHCFLHCQLLLFDLIFFLKLNRFRKGKFDMALLAIQSSLMLQQQRY
jgi:hypothetical protein